MQDQAAGVNRVFANVSQCFPRAIFKRGMKGVYQHCAKKHLHRHLAEFDFRYSNREANGYNDPGRADALFRGIVGKRLTYETIGARA